MTDRINERNKEIMSSIFDKVQPAVKKETRRVAMITAVGLVLMWILFAGLHFAMPDKVPLSPNSFTPSSPQLPLNMVPRVAPTSSLVKLLLRMVRTLVDRVLTLAAVQASGR